MADKIFPEDETLRSFAPRLRKNIREIWINGKIGYVKGCLCIGIASLTMKIHVLGGDHSEDGPQKYKDNFLLEIPYAGKSIFCEVCFKDEDYDFPPDFEFTNDNFLLNPDIDTISEKIPSLAKWDVDNAESLVSVVRELMSFYKTHQVNQLYKENRYSRLCSEYDFLKTQLPDVEIFIDSNGSVYFLISIKINFSCLPPYIQPILVDGDVEHVLNPSEDIALLRVAFFKPDGTKMHCDLQLSPRLEQIIGNPSMLHIPFFHKDTHLLDYTAQVTKLLETKIEQIANHYKLKNDYISCLLSMFGYCIVEYDSTLFSKAVLLTEVNNFYTLITICIGNRFPQEKPKVTVSSVYHLQFDKPISLAVEIYPYSCKWKPEEMIRKLVHSLKIEIPKFQEVCQSITK